MRHTALGKGSWGEGDGRDMATLGDLLREAEKRTGLGIGRAPFAMRATKRCLGASEQGFPHSAS